MEAAPKNKKHPIDQEVDLIEYLNEILRVKYRLTFFAVMAGIAGYSQTLLVNETYVATSVNAVNVDNKVGGVAPKEFRTSETIGYLERDVAIVQTAADNEKDRLLARMASYKFSQIFISENNLLPYIFNKEWDSVRQVWKEGRIPDMRLAVKAFDSNIRWIDYEEKTGLLRVSFSTRDPELSAKLTNLFVARFNLYVKELALNEIAERRSYLEGRLKNTRNLELHRSIYRILESQLAAESVLHARTTFPLEEIQPAVAPIYKNAPKRLFTASLSFIGALFAGIIFMIAKVLVQRIRKELADYGNLRESVLIQQEDNTWIDSKK